jgi:hypothetical protein
VFTHQKLNAGSEWILSQKDPKRDRAVYYKHSTTPGLLSVKVECSMSAVNPLHLIAHAKECDTANTWIPMTFHSSKPVDIGGDSGVEAVVHIAVGMKAIGMSRDMLLRFFGNDSLENHGVYHFLSASAGEDEDNGLYGWENIKTKIPPPKATRMTIKYCVVEITMMGPNSFRCRLMAELDPKVAMVPDVFVNYATRKIMYVAIGLLEGILQKMHVLETSTKVGEAMQLEKNQIFYDSYKRKFKEMTMRLFGEGRAAVE